MKAEQLSDAILLERFVSRREEAAFGALVARHAPLVRRVCSRILRNEHDVEDVVQTTFLVLARKAALIPWQTSVAAWVGSVAHRLALGARSDAARLKRREVPFTTLAQDQAGDDAPAGDPWLQDHDRRWTDPAIEIERNDLKGVLDHELLQLPEKYRAPVVLCYLEGRRTRKPPRSSVGPSGSISRRLERGRTLLRRRLVHRGVALSIGLIACACAVVAAWSVVPRPGPNSPAVRTAMRALAPVSAPGKRVESVLDRIARPDRACDPAQIVAFARQAARMADQIEELDPRGDRDRWRDFTNDMRLSAVQLAQTTQQNNYPGILAAARRLDASCRNCHAVFH